MKLAVIDIGSNTIKITVYRITASLEEIYSKTIYAKLSSHICEKQLSQKGISVLVSAVNDLKRTARTLGCKKQNIFAFATACVRGAVNREYILSIAQKSTKIKIDLLSGDAEAELCFLGALSSKQCPTSGVLADLGGGSCELIAFENSLPTNKTSLNIGALAMYKKFSSGRYLTFEELKTLEKYLENELKTNADCIKMPDEGKFIVTGGTARAAVKMLSKIEEKENSLPYEISLDKAKELCKKITSGYLISLCEKTAKERSQTLTSGLAVFIKTAENLGVSYFTVIEGGARSGFVRHIISSRGKLNG